MTTVSFPNIEATFQTAMTEVLSPYLSSVNSQVVGGELTHFSPMDIRFTIDQVKPVGKPRLIIVGTRTAEILSGRCGPTRRRIKQFSANKTLYLTLPKVGIIDWNDEGVPKKVVPSWAILEKAWAQISTVIHTQQTQFGNRGIRNPRTSLSPVQVPDEEFFSYFSPFTCELEASYEVE